MPIPAVVVSLPSTWTEALDAQIRRLRAENATWDEIARLLGRSQDLIEARARAISARCAPPDFVRPHDDPGREPLPAGHPRSWGPLTAGTLLEGVDYPLPFIWNGPPGNGSAEEELARHF